MRVTDGSVSARFQALRLPMGDGPRRPGRADRARPTPRPTTSPTPRSGTPSDIDAGVRDEGLVAILGVPLLLGTRVIGVLFAADRVASARSTGRRWRCWSRSPRTPRSRWTTPGCSTRPGWRWTSCPRPRGSSRAHTAAVERAAAAHDRFVDVVLRGGGSVDDVAAAVTETLGGAVTVLDEDGRVAGAEPRRRGRRPAARRAGACLSLARSTGRTVRDGHAGGPPPSPSDNELLGGLVLQLHGRPLRRRPADPRARPRWSPRCCCSSAGPPARPRTGCAASCWRSCSPAPPATPRACASAPAGSAPTWTGRTPSSSRAVEERARGRALACAVHLAATRGGLAAGARRRRRPLPARAAPGDGGRPGAPGADRDVGAPGDLRRRRAGDRRGRRWPAPGPRRRAAPPRWSRSAAAARPRAPTSSASSACWWARAATSAAFVETTLGPVLEYDARRGTDLAGTLQAFFDAGSSPARAAETLRVHVNTVTQRLDRVGRLLGTRLEPRPPGRWRSSSRCGCTASPAPSGG